MSLPREVLPDRVYMITRRCTQRQFLMRPDRDTNNAFVYCLAEAAARFGIDILFTVATSNHHHTGIRDVRGNYPAFLEHFHKMFAKCQNSLRGRWENFWSSEQTSVVRLVDPEDILAKMVYALANPVKDHLVARCHEWPGITALGAITRGTTLAAQRPGHFFRTDGPMPARVVLRFARPPGWEKTSAKEFSAVLAERLRAVEAAAAAERAKTGRQVLGRAAILAQHWDDRPGSHEPRRQLSPRVAAKNKWSRIEALLRNKTFLNRYYPARTAFVSGTRDVLFPPGTWLMRTFVAVECDERTSSPPAS